MKYQILDWDSDFFGMTVARINEQNPTADELIILLSELKHKFVKLVYWPSERKYDDNIIKRLNGNLLDIKTTFAIDFNHIVQGDFNSPKIVEVYSESMPLSDLEDLAIQSGEYSRFAVDPNLPRDKYIALYKTWIKQSLCKKLANEVLVIRDTKHTVGVITLGEKNGRGDIGLIAVNIDHRGKKYGKKLIHAAQQWFVKNEYRFGQVVTQGLNIPACNLYKKCGYSIEKVEYYYHFWL